MKKFFVFLLLFYAIIILIGSRPQLWGDEGRYLKYSENLLHGYYAPQGTDYLWNGPGYPLLLMPFVALKMPWIVIKLFNALLLYFAVIYLYKTMRLYIPEKTAFWVALLGGLYLPFFRWLPFMLTEILSVFFICGFTYYFCRFIKDKESSKKNLVLSVLLLASLALTKIFFGYVMLGMLCGCLILYVLFRKRVIRKACIVYFFALCLCLPYLLYTYSVSGSFFYWANSGGMSLYWMSSPHEGDLGDWFSEEEIAERPFLSKNHLSVFESLKGLSYCEQDKLLKKIAIENIKNHPKKYFKNWCANIGRLFFNYPYSYTPQKLSTYYYIFPNMLLLTFWLISFVIAFFVIKKVPFEMICLMIFVFITCLGSSFVSAYNRQFMVVAPMVFVWIMNTFFIFKETKLHVNMS